MSAMKEFNDNENDLESLNESVSTLAQQIIGVLFDSENNINLKTIVYHPQKVALLGVFCKVLKYYADESNDFKECAEILEDYLQLIKELMISEEGRGRDDAINIFKGSLENIRTSISAKLTKNLKEL